ncbi:MAG TPA: YceI family protein, partial [Oceanipulchritudo sp.]|nr:YceI family protein [Oceanipulchritudo sp.]
VIVFESESIEVRDPAEWVIRGQLIIRDRSAPVEIVAAIDRYAEGRLRSRGTVELMLADFGIEPVSAVGGMMRTGKTVKIRFDFIGTTQATAEPNTTND